jgi:uncharacterized OB-fold protein
MAETVSPVVNHLSRPFWDAAAEGRLCLPVCVGTGRVFWPPSPSSPFVSGGAVAWRDQPAGGVMLGRVTYRRAFQTAFAARLPYAVALVEIAPDARLQAHLSDPDSAEASRAGDQVRLGFAALVEGGPAVLIIRSA